MNRFVSLLFAATTLFALPALAFDLPGDFDSITGGRKVKEGDPIAQTTVGLTYEEDGKSYRCSGTIIAENLVLTAAHCLLGSRPMIFFGDMYDYDNAVYSSAMVIPAAYKDDPNQSNRYDIGLVMFRGGLPSGSTPARFLEHRRLTNGETAVMAGYGRTDLVLGKSSDQLRKTKLRLKNVRYSRTEVEARHGLRRGICSGDSGGPAFVQENGQYYLWGVTNTGNGQGWPVRACGTHSVYADVSNQNLQGWLAAAALRMALTFCSLESCDKAFRL